MAGLFSGSNVGPVHEIQDAERLLGKKGGKF